MGTMEQFVKKEKTFFTTFLVILLYVAAVGLTILLYMAAGRIAFVVAPFFLLAAIIFGKYIIMMSKVEHEYSISNGVLNIDKIFDQSKRQPLLNIPIIDIPEFGCVTDEAALKAEKRAKKVYYCGTNDENEDAFYFVCDYQSKGPFMFVIEPNDQILRTMASYNPAVKRAAEKKKPVSRYGE